MSAVHLAVYLCSGIAIAYLERVAIAQAMPAMAAEFGMSAQQQGWLFSAFSWGYVIGMLPGGVLVRRIGGHRSFMVAVGLTQGLICYRSGLPSVGAELYRKAILEAVKLKLLDFKARAMLYFAREKSICNDPDADQMFELGYQEAVKLSRSDLIWLAGKIKGQILEQKLKRKANGRPGD